MHASVVYLQELKLNKSCLRRVRSKKNMTIPLSIIMNVRSGHHGEGHEMEMRLIAQSLRKSDFDV